MKKLQNEALHRLTQDEFRKAAKLPVVMVLDNVRSALNAGSVFRTADAFLFEAVWCCGITAIPPHKEILKTALGATDTVNWKYFEKTADALAVLRKLGYRIVGIEQTDASLSLEEVQINTQQKYALVFGHEVKGIDAGVLHACDAIWEIPQKGTKHSLNISVAAGIVAWEVFRKWHA